MHARETATIVLSGVIMVLGLVQIGRAASAGAGVVAWVIGIALVVAGAGRLWLWWRQRAA
jgi:uncharacterized membrane protein HdeD (DUF308 family)